MYIGGGSITLYNATVALNSSGVFQSGGSVNLYNSLFADNGYSGSGTGPTGADYSKLRRLPPSPTTACSRARPSA